MKLLIMIVALGIASAASFAGEVQKIDFETKKGKSLLVIHHDGSGKFRFFQSEKQKNVILEAENIALPARLTKIIDGSKSDGPVLQVTPYSSGSAGKSISKFVLQLRERADVTSSDLPGRFVLELGRMKLGSDKVGRSSRQTWTEDSITNVNGAAEKGDDVAKKLVEVLNAVPEKKEYFGSKVSFEGTAVEVHDIFRLVGEASGLNIVTDSDVKYSSNYSLKDVPWDQLLDIVVQQAQLRAAVSGNVVRIISLDRYTKEQLAKVRETELTSDMEPVVMSVIPLSFATAEEMKKMIETLLVKRDKAADPAAAAPTPTPAPAASASAKDSASGAGAATGESDQKTTKKVDQDFVRGQIQVDSRSNSLIVTNTKETIDRIRRLVKELDVPLPQVLIDSKIVIADENYAKKIGFGWGGRAASGGSGRAGLGGGFNTGQRILGDGAGSDSQFIVSPGTAGAFGFRVGAGRHGNLDAQLSLSETNGLSKTVASPRVIVNNKKTATISDGSTLYFQSSAGANAAGNFEKVTADLRLTVTPQVTSDNSVLLNVDIEKGSALPAVPGSPPGVANKKISTEVLVDNSSTLVLGGVYQFGATKSVDGIPMLMDLPFIGQLFRNNIENKTKTELMVFITPQIIEPNQSLGGRTNEM